MWLVGGDRNTSIFDAKASNKHQRNSIEGMCVPKGIWQEDDHQVKTIVVDYFSSIFKSNRIIDASVVVGAIQPLVTESMNRGLVQEFQVAEVVKALKQMHPKKSPSSNVMPSLFYQHYLSLVGNYVTQTIFDFLNHGITPPKFNESHLVLIPKIKNPNTNHPL